MMEEEIAIPAGDITLAGTLTIPENAEKPALVLCIHGTGPLDRDENIPNRQKLNVFNAFAEHFAANGIACLRYDKRGIGESTGTYITHGLSDLVQDARAALDWARETGRFGAIYALGHSEGTVIAPQLEQADGLLLIAPFATPMADILRNQAETLDWEISRAPGFSGWLARRMFQIFGGPQTHQERMIRKLRATNRPTFRVMFKPIAARSLRDHLALDHTALFSRVRQPTFIISCGQDLQCPPGDGVRIARMIGPSAKAALLPEVSHILREVQSDVGFKGYAEQMKRPISADVLAVTTDWLKAQAATSSSDSPKL